MILTENVSSSAASSQQLNTVPLLVSSGSTRLETRVFSATFANSLRAPPTPSSLGPVYCFQDAQKPANFFLYCKKSILTTLCVSYWLLNLCFYLIKLRWCHLFPMQLEFRLTGFSFRRLRVQTNTRLHEPCWWTFFASSQGASLQIFRRTDLRCARKKRGTIVQERRDTNEEIIIPRICFGLLSVMRRDSKQTKKIKRFHWTVFDSDQHAL